MTKKPKKKGYRCPNEKRSHGVQNDNYLANCTKYLKKKSPIACVCVNTFNICPTVLRRASK